MKSHFLILAFLMLATADIYAQTVDWAKFGRYHNSNIELASKANNGDRVVFFGNSITDNRPHCSAEFWNAHPNYVGRGISGQSSYNMLSRFREDVINLSPA